MAVERESALVQVSIRKVITLLAVVSAIFTVMGIVTQLVYVAHGGTGPSDPYTWTHLFDLDAEAALPAWYQTGLLLVCGALLWIAGAAHEAGTRFAGHWKFLGLVFVYISADENATIHETLGFWISSHLPKSLDVYAWLIPGIAFVVFMAIGSVRFLRHLPTKTRNSMLVAAVVYVFGAAGVELIEARLDMLWGTLPFTLLTVLEETMEIAGLLIMIHALLVYLKNHTRPTLFSIEP